MAESATVNRNDQSNASDRQILQGDMQPMPDLAAYMKAYARENPEVCAMWCFGVGFVLGWKLKPW